MSLPVPTVYVQKPRRKNKKKKGDAKVATVGTVKKLINKNIEHKYFDFIFGATGIYNAPAIYALTSITQGLTDSNRVGDSIIYKSFTVDYILRQGASTIPIDYRIMFVQWYDMSRTPIISDILQHTATDDQTLCSPVRWDDKGSFKILKDLKGKIVPVNAYGAQVEKRGHFSVSLGRKHVQFDAGTVVSDNVIYVIAFANVGVIVNKPELVFTSRVTYTDA